MHEYTQCKLGDVQALAYEKLAIASHSIRSNVLEATGYSPGALAFHRDMFLDVPYVADLLALRKRRQLKVDNNLHRVNAKRVSHDYKVNDKIFKKCHEWSKLGKRWEGPYTIQRVHVNGNVTVHLQTRVTECLNIRRVKPYYEPTVQSMGANTNPAVPVQPVGHRTRARS